MTDDTRGRREIAEQLCEKWFDTGARASWCPAMVDDFSAALADARLAGMEEAAKCVPTNWVDSLLTGPNGLDAAKRRIDCRVIEKLLRGIQDRIRTQAQAGLVG